MTDKPRSKSERVATAEELSQAIEQLRPEDWAKLFAHAENRSRFMKLYGAAVDGHDLVQRAVTELLEGRRAWNPKNVSFVGVLFGAMRSIASNHKANAVASGYTVPDKQITNVDEGDKSRTLTELHPDPSLNPEQQLIAAENEDDLTRFVEILYEHFGEDIEAMLVMDGWKEDLSGSEIIKSLEIDRKGYETIVRRIRRKSIVRWPKGSSHDI
ncbi:MAG TPA: hypothetical protein VKB38_11730 [Terracidiphilus sp.]|nr:hypothetical protein [Terracidiphilus sp.]